MDTQLVFDDAGRLPSGAFEQTLGSFQPQPATSTESAGDFDVVVIGGGLSGLSAVWKLADRRILLLDERNRIGGNARLEEHGGLRYASAASCLQHPVAGSETAELLQDLGLWNKWQTTNDDTLVIFETRQLLHGLGEMVRATLKSPVEMLSPRALGLTARLVKHAIIGEKYLVAHKKLGDPVFKDLFAYLDRFKPGSGKYPEVPWNASSGWTREEMEAFDAISLRQLFVDPAVRKALPAGLAPEHIPGSLTLAAMETSLRVECLSLDEASAYVGLNLLVGYLRGTLITFPGGNGYIAECLGRLLGERENCTLRGEARALSITTEGGPYQVIFEQEGKHYLATARSIVWAAPKHDVQEIITGLPQVQTAAIAEIEHRDYCIANVFVDSPVLAECFGGYLVAGDTSRRDEASWCSSGACLSANWMDKQFTGQTGILTLLIPVTGLRNRGRVANADFRQIQRSIYENIREVLEAQGISGDVIEDIKIWRWPRGLVVSKVGQLKSDLFVRASQPFGGVFFANQDSVGIGNLESAVHAGYLAARQVTRYLASAADDGFPSD
jgi:protoporphyrinogen oxidase